MKHENNIEAKRLAAMLRSESDSESRNIKYSTARNSAKMLDSQHARIAELEAALVKEAARTAEQKLRADQMSQQHSTQAALNSEARSELAAVKAELAKAREVPEMPEPDAYMATFKPAGIDALHSVAGSSIEALKYSVPTDSVFTPLLKWSTVRAMFERNKG